MKLRKTKKDTKIKGKYSQKNEKEQSAVGKQIVNLGDFTIRYVYKVGTFLVKKTIGITCNPKATNEDLVIMLNHPL